MALSCTRGETCPTGSKRMEPGCCLPEPLEDRLTVSTKSDRERVILVGLSGPARSREDTEADLAELARLTGTAGGFVVGRLWQERDRMDPATMVGRGKGEEVGRGGGRVDAGTIVFDAGLLAGPTRN